MAPTAAPSLRSTTDGRRLVIEAAGTWTAARADDLERLVDAVATAGGGAEQVEIHLSGVERIDTYGAWLIERMRRAFPEGPATALVGLDPRFQSLLDEIHGANRHATAAPDTRRGVVDLVVGTGRAVVGVGRDVVDYAAFLGEVVLALVRAIPRPVHLRPIAIVHHLERVALAAAPIIIMITFLIGAIVAQQGIFHFRKFGAETFVVDMVGILTLRELSVLLVSVMLAGRSGSAYTAELGSMKMREETDALRVMGLDPVEVLVLPRVIALVVALPLLTFIGSLAALTGGGLVSWLYGGMSPEVYVDRLREAISLDHFEVGMIKAPFMALVIGVIACVEGMRVKGSAESLGLHTTASVVKSIFVVIVLDGLFAMFFAAIDK